MSSLGSTHAALAGVVVTTVTPFRSDGQVDLSRLAEHTHYLVDNGITALLPNGNTGEFSSLDSFERQRVASTVVEAAAGRAVVVVGVGGATSEAVDLARHARDIGAEAVMIHHPAHTYVDRSALRGYYERIIEAVDIDVMIYKRGPEVTDELLADLVELEGVVAVKYAVADPIGFGRLVASSPPDVVWLNGLAERWAPYFHLSGAAGFTSGLANFAPQVALRLHRALANGDVAEAMRLHAKVLDFEELRQIDHGAYNVSAVKSAMQFLGLGVDTVREPLAPLSRERRRLVREAIRSWPAPRRQEQPTAHEAVRQ